MKFFIIFSHLMLLLFSHSVSANKPNQCDSNTSLTFGVLPFVSAEQLVIRFTPLVNYLSLHLNTEVRIETAPNFIEFSNRTIKNQRYDILFTAPHFYSLASKVGYRLIASVDSPGMRAVIVVPKESHIQNINDLKNKKLATVEAVSMATLLVRKHLLKQGIDPDNDLTIITTPTHDASLLSTYHGVTDASVVMRPPYEASSQQVRDSMRIIEQTVRGPHIPISVNSRISPTCVNQIASLLLNMNKSDAGKAVLKFNRFAGFRQPKPNEYENIEAIIQ